MNVFATVVCPEAHRADALVLAEGAMNFIPQFTIDTEGAPPPTHRMNSGYIPEAIRDAFVTDGRFVVSDQPWTVVAAQMGITRVVYL
jgi:hypothetical protein